MKTIKSLLLIAGALATGASAATIQFTLNPANGSLSGQAGKSVGWGYTISTSSDFVTIESIFFGDMTPVGAFSTPGIPSAAASAGSPIVIPFVKGVSGLQYDINPGAIFGAASHGKMTLVYDTYSDSNLTNQIGFGDQVNAQFGGSDVTASVSVSAPTSAVPEPSGLAAMGIMAVFLVNSKRLRLSAARNRARY
jgi:hypothetical protein